jgi:hypothetical protein
MRCARYASAIGAAVVSCVAGVFAIAPAKADVFDFSFGAPSCVNEPTSPCASGRFAIKCRFNGALTTSESWRPRCVLLYSTGPY